MRFVRTALVIALAGPACDTRSSSPREQQPIASSPPAARAGARPPVRPRGPRGVGPEPREHEPPLTAGLVEVVLDALCVTTGELVDGRVEVPTFRAVVPAHDGDAAAVRVVVHGATATTRALASGQRRRQLGLKLRAQDGCNLVYVMWRLDPQPKVEVSVKRNPGARTAKECGARGYTKVRPALGESLPALDDGQPHELRAAIAGNTLTAWVDDRVVWRGTLPAAARDLSGPAGIRSDNLAFELAELAVENRAGRDLDIECRRSHAESD